MPEFPDWIDKELKRELSPVRAPDTLWAAIAKPRAPKRTPRLILWPAFALVVLLASAELLSQVGRDTIGLPSGHPIAVRLPHAPDVKAYRVEETTVLVSNRPIPGENLYSWTKRDQIYAIPATGQETCLHCHVAHL